MYKHDKTINSFPILAFQTLTNFLKKEGFQVECNFILETAFRATYGSDDGPNVCLICEYDALPGIGHACGHNLIAECGIAAGIAVKAALEVNGGKDGKVRSHWGWRSGSINVCMICEYDALPGIGYACGHNLIAECGIAAGIAVKAALEVNGGKDGKVRSHRGEEGGVQMCVWI